MGKTLAPLIGVAVVMFGCMTVGWHPGLVLAASAVFLAYAVWALLWRDLDSVWPLDVWRSVRGDSSWRAVPADPNAAALANGSWG